MTVAVTIQNLSKSYGDVKALDDVSIDIRSGEIFGLLGPNGAGKTTLIETVVGMRQPDRGRAIVLGMDVATQGQQVREKVGISLQQAALTPEARVIEIVRLYASLYKNPHDVGTLIHQFQLENVVKRRCGQLSGGTRQRLALALAVIGRPQIVFLDEPTTGLDPASRRQLWDRIFQLKDEGRTVVLSTHYMEEAERLCDRIAIIHRGRLLALDTPTGLMNEHGPERSIEVQWVDPLPDPVDLSQLAAVTGLVQKDGTTKLLTADPAATLLSLAQKVHEAKWPLGDLHLRRTTLEDVFLSLTGKELTPHGE